MDIALGIEQLLPAAEYLGSTTANTKECFDNLNWLDERSKPTWKQIQDAYATYKIEAEAKEAQRQAILDRLGLTADEAKLILG